MLGRIRNLALSQENIVFLLAIVLFLAFSIFLKGFLSTGNLVTLVRGVAILGILGVGMAIVVIGRGIDLTIVAIYAMSAAWTLQLASFGVSIPAALLLGFLLALMAGVINGVLIAYLEIPALFGTLGMTSLFYGFVHYALVPLQVVYLPASLNAISWIGGGFVFGAPTPILFFALISFLGFVFLRFSKPGRFIYAIGDNFLAARISGAPVRPDHRSAIRGVRIDRVCRWHGHRDRSLQHEHCRRELLVDLRCDPGRGAWRRWTFRRTRRHPQRDRRHAADRHFAERDDHHEYRIYAAECDPESDPACCDRSRQRGKSAGRTDRAARRHLERLKGG